MSPTKQSAKWHLGTQFNRSQMLRKTADHFQPPGPVQSISFFGQSRPSQSQFGGQRAMMASSIGKGAELLQQPSLSEQSIAQSAAEFQVPVDFFQHSDSSGNRSHPGTQFSIN